ncbi:diaminopropionate ammonia-lyase [Metarhizium rileyi]|uniref:Diaminopropionate ammonia-lyase n=1 Tax=Metarhizium rileyi (strain RCEF 4871) TaxID=1649241 RepID=A0A167AVE2_METRR|nr:diaminopropionate ammonia-lyase [Metarhizium rileyi RCEF 4871]
MTSHYLNSKRLTKETETEAAPCVQNLQHWRDAVAEIQAWPEYEPQPLRSLPVLAKHIGITKLLFKDESRRYGTNLASFKAIGAPYALYKILAREVRKRVGVSPSSADLRCGKYREITQQVTVCVSTDGNQGRGLAYGAKLFGCPCVIYIHREVSPYRTQRLKDLGATVLRVDGDQKAAADRAREDARMNGWHFVSSTSWNDFDGQVPQDVMNAYMVVVREAIEAVENVQHITHVLVCGGTGSISSRIFLGFYSHLQEVHLHQGLDQIGLPRFVVIEPSEADCLLESAKNGSPQMSKGSLSTLMAGLACRAPSPAAWKVLSWLASDFVAVPDSVAVAGMRALANAERTGDLPIVCGESSASTMGLLLETSRDTLLREKLGLSSDSQVLLFGLEGATDPEMYQKLVGLTSEAVFDAQSLYICQKGQVDN